MSKRSVRELLRDAVNGAIASKRTTQVKMVAAGAVSNGALGRLRHAVDNVGVDTLEAVAHHLGVEPWELLHPAFNADAATEPRLSDEARELGRALDAITDAEVRRRVHAIALQVVMLNPYAMQPAKPAAQPAEENAQDDFAPAARTATASPARHR